MSVVKDPELLRELNGRDGLALLGRICKRVLVNDDGCWIWQGPLHQGYGRIRWPRTRLMMGVYRAMYLLAYGAIPEGHVVHHECANRACVNPAHLRAVTQRENIALGESHVAEQMRKTHCKRGHPLRGKILYTDPDGKRYCRYCRSERKGSHGRAGQRS